MHRVEEVRASPRSGLWGCCSNFEGMREKPIWVGMVRGLAKKAGGKRIPREDSGVWEGALSYMLTFEGRRAM